MNCGLSDKKDNKQRSVQLKIVNRILVVLLTFLSVASAASTKNVNKNFVTESDSLSLMAEVSLFFEAYKNKQYDDWTIEQGFKVISMKPDAYPELHIYRKLEKVIWAAHDDSTTSEEMKKNLADSVLILYNKAIKYDTAYVGNYLVHKGYVLETWLKAPPDSSIAAYEKGFATGQKINSKSYYMDRLGQLYANNAPDENSYKIKAVEIYSKLSEDEPENPRWTERMASLAEDEDQLIDIMHKSWLMNKDNKEKAWRYASTCIKYRAWDKAIEPLEFLTEKEPNVINYWKELSRAYEKSDKVDKAISAYKKLINLEPNNRDNYVNLALLYKKIDQLAVARSYLHKALKISPDWDYPVYIEGTLYEQAARDCGFKFEDKVVYQLAVDTYRKAQHMGGNYSETAAERVNALKNSVPTKEDYFFRHYKNNDKIKIGGKCYGWINKTITVRY